MRNQKVIYLKMQLSVLKAVERQYRGRSIGNVIDNIEARIRYEEEK